MNERDILIVIWTLHVVLEILEQGENDNMAAKSLIEYELSEMESKLSTKH